MARQNTRRSFLAAGGLVTLTALSGCSAVRSRVEGVVGELPDLPGRGGAETQAVGGSLPGSIEGAGSYEIIVPGDDREDVLAHHYRSDDGPLRMESNVGGLTAVGPVDDGVEVVVELTEDDVYGAAGFSFGQLDIASVEAISFAATADLVLALQLGIANNGGTIGEWEETGDGLERQVSFDGDDRALTEYVAGPEGPFTREEAIWSSPPDGGAGPLSDLSLDDIQDQFGNVPVRVAGSIDGGPGSSRRTVVERFRIELSA